MDPDRLINNLIYFCFLFINIRKKKSLWFILDSCYYSHVLNSIKKSVILHHIIILTYKKFFVIKCLWYEWINEYEMNMNYFLANLSLDLKFFFSYRCKIKDRIELINIWFYILWIESAYMGYTAWSVRVVLISCCLCTNKQEKSLKSNLSQRADTFIDIIKWKIRK